MIDMVPLLASAPASDMMLILAQSTDKKPIIIVITLVLVILAVFVLSRTAGKGTAKDPADEKPVVEQDEGPLVKPGQLTDKRLEERQVISSKDYGRLQAIKDMGLLSPAQVKTFNLVKEDGSVRRDNAMDSTSQSQAAHEDGSIDDIEVTKADKKLVESILGGTLKLPEAQEASVDASSDDVEEEAPTPPKAEEPVVVEAEEPKDELDDIGKDLKEGLGKTRGGFGAFGSLFKTKKETIDEDLLSEIEEFLYTADIGTKAAEEISQAIESQVENIKDPEAVWEFVRGYIHTMLKNMEVPLKVEEHKPFVILVIGVNGAGKTTTIGKLASQYKRQGKEVMIVAGDTFRAAAVEQLEVWGDRAHIPVHRGEQDVDPASVVYSGITRGIEEGMDVILCDTSGRLHNNTKLMDELAKISRVSGKALDGAPHETILVLDANMGQNAIMQAKSFNAALNITGIALTKLDGTARGGVILAIDKELNVPVRFIGIGEGINDLRAFNADEFAEALFL